MINVTGSDQLQYGGHYTIAGTGSMPKTVQAKGAVQMEYKGVRMNRTNLFLHTPQ